MKKKPTLIAEIAVIIAIKLSIVFGLWYFFFSPSHRPDVTASSMGNVLVGKDAKTPQQPTKQ